MYPVQLSTQLIPPYSGYLPDYADPSSEKLKIILQFNDFLTPQYNIKLKLEIKGNGFSIVTKQLFNPPPIVLQPGIPTIISGVDLAPYLNSSNLDFIGINQAQYENRMALPEGFYSICVTAYDYYNPGKIQVSNQSCSNAWFTLSNPPFLNLPLCSKNITPQVPQNIVFQWTPVNIGSPNSATSTEYDFELWEVRPDSSVNPNQIVLSTAPIYSTTTNLTLINYGIAEPPLNLYMKYVWRVRARDLSGRDWFKNNGYSQICTFVYGNLSSVLGNALNLTLNANGITHRMGHCTWNTQSIYTNYKLQVRKQGTQNWFDYNTSGNFEKVNNLEPNTDYEARVRGEGSALTGDWSNVATFRTLSEPVYGCGDQNFTPDAFQAQPLPISKAVPGLIIQSGQFEVKASQITPNGPQGWYSGKGTAEVYGFPIAVKFNNIYIDDNNRHQQGIIEALTEGITAWTQQWDQNFAEENASYIPGKIDSIWVSGNQICVKIQGDDSCFTMPPNQNIVVVRDGEGNQYNVQTTPPPPKITGPFNYITYGNDNIDAKDSCIVHFEQSSNQQFGFDKKQYAAWLNNYETIKLNNGKTYYVPYKSVGENASDKVKAEIKIIPFDANKLSFKTRGGQVCAHTSAGANSYEVTVPADAGCVYAYYDSKKIGKLNVVTLKQQNRKLVLVPVNNAALSVSNVQSELNKLFGQANVNWSVTTKSSFNFNLGNDGLEAADANLLSKYSTEMRAVRDAYKSYDSLYDKEAYYIFVVNNFNDPGIKGYMVRGRGLGFVAANASVKHLAHELAHGAFGLEHTFPAIAQNTSNNLMDYKVQGVELSAMQWEEILNNKLVISWFDTEEDGSSISINSNCFFDVSDKYLYAPNGKLFKAPSNSKVAHVLSSFLVNGFVYGLEVNSKVYWADVPVLNGLNTDGSFNGFISVEKDVLALNYLNEVPQGEYGHFLRHTKSSFALYKLLNASQIPGSTQNTHDINAGFDIDNLILNATASHSCNTTNPLTNTQQQLLDKYKNFSVQHETYIYEQGNLLTLLPSGKKYIKHFSSQHFSELKTKLKQGKLNNNEAVILEKTLSGYNISINYGSNIKAKAGYDPSGDAIDKSELAFEKVMNRYLKNVNDLSAIDNQEASQNFEDGKSISVKSSSFWDKIKNGIKATREFIESAEISQKYWNSTNAEYPNNWVNTPPMLSGIGNGVINEIKEIPQLVLLGAEIATDKTARTKLWESLNGLNLTKIKNAALNSLSNWADTYAQGGDIAWHQGGKDAVLVFSAITATGFLKNADDVLEENVESVSKKVSINGSLPFESAREFVRNKYGQNTLNQLAAKFGSANEGVAAVIIQKWDNDGLNILNKTTVNTIDDVAKELVTNKTMYRYVNETSFNFNKLKTQGLIEASPTQFPGYATLDKIEDAALAKSILQLPKEPTWVAEFSSSQIINDVRFPTAKFNNSNYYEVLTRSYPEWGIGGGSQFITNSQIKITRLKNLKTGEVINFPN